MVLFLLMGMHLVPGFDHPLKVDLQLVKPGAVPITMHINFDQGLAGLLLLPCSAKPTAGAIQMLATTLAGILPPNRAD